MGLPFYAKKATLRGVPLGDIMAGAKKGDLLLLKELRRRIADYYSLAILDIFLGHLREPDPAVKLASYHRACAYECILALLDIAKACKVRPSLLELSVGRIVQVLPGIVHWIYLTLGLRDDEWCPGSTYAFQDFVEHEEVMLALLEVAKLHEKARNAITSNLSLIDFSVMSWVATRNRLPVLYPEGNHKTCYAVDPTIDFLYLISDNRPTELASALLSGRICSPGRFFLQASQRAWMLADPNLLPHISHTEDIPVDRNLDRVARTIDALVNTHPDLALPMLESMSPACIMDALVRSMERSSLIGCAVGRVHYLEHILGDAVLVAGWVETDSSFFIPTSKSVISSGLIRLLGYCITLPDDTHATVATEDLLTLIKHVVNWSTSPNLLQLVSSAVSQHLVPKLAELKDESVLKGAVDNALHMIDHFNTHWGSSRSVQLCDNMAHKWKGHSQDTQDQSSGTCSGCHSVAYCSTSCQRHDWKTFHRNECRGMRSEYLDSKHFNTRYSYKERAFQTTVLLAFCSPNLEHDGVEEQQYPKAGDIAMVNIAVADPVWYLSLPEYVKMMRPLVPKHLVKRFEKVLEMYAEAESAETLSGCTGLIELSVGLAHGMIRRSRDAADVLLVLFRRLPRETSDDNPLPSFSIEASLVYRIHDPEHLTEAMKIMRDDQRMVHAQLIHTNASARPQSPCCH
ncbi:hypothetical protein NMY22_g3169 [Coprinellus aureogranulatus]|nr:hypothetical protein NMY22_g3169 [Coprinellus aureogranulatus]